MTDDELAALLARSVQLQDTILEKVAGLAPVPEHRYLIASQSGELSLEHAGSALALLHVGFKNSAIALLRLQYESTVRAVWLLYAASDSWVDKLTQPLTEESAQKANSVPMLADMLKELRTSDANPGLINQLEQFRDVSWKALNSYVHGGLHPLTRSIAGHPPLLVGQVLRNCNGLACITMQLLSILTGSKAIDVRAVHDEFSDCLPLLTLPE